MLKEPKQNAELIAKSGPMCPQCFGTLEGHSDWVLCIIEMRNGLVISGGSDSKMKIWKVEKRECVGTLEGNSGNVYCMIELRNGLVISDGSDSKI